MSVGENHTVVDHNIYNRVEVSDWCSNGKEIVYDPTVQEPSESEEVNNCSHNIPSIELEILVRHIIILQQELDKFP